MPSIEKLQFVSTPINNDSTFLYPFYLKIVDNNEVGIKSRTIELYSIYAEVWRIEERNPTKSLINFFLSFKLSKVIIWF